ncbi:hypothetical protein yc1106_01446 [Curvularia clavata]|uniref:ubiquitinyl hydrolase 1 n=1 Tax=Curvularia clavata TaxID=95742 RepID=A0A9Q8Z146_CURCL|nr:hypothetical protein yc1106_01446 [Curvularia clavata]
MAPLTALMDGTAYLYHHVVLPPKLPQEDDRNATNDVALLTTATRALKALKGHVKSEYIGLVEAAKATVDNLIDCREQDGHTSDLPLQNLLVKIANGETAGMLPIEIWEQNAGVLASRSGDDVQFEFFELSPTNEATMNSGRLVRSFPGHAAKVSIIKMTSEDLRQSISSTLATMTTQKVPSFQPKITKNGKSMSEERDTTHPGMVTNFYMNTITAFGGPADVKRIRKHTREEVLWNDCLNPWRRSPLWLLLRVSLQLLFARKAPDALHEDGLYKAFMIFMLTEVLDLARRNWKDFGSEPVYIISAKLTRRLRKFKALKQNQYLKPSWDGYIETAVLDAHSLIDRHWQGLVENVQDNIDTSDVAKLQPETDLDMHLSELEAFISEAASRKPEQITSTYVPTSVYPTFCPSKLPSDLTGPEDYKHFRLAALEEWVEDYLADWTNKNLLKSNSCERLRALMERYHKIASVAYEQAPIAMSIMYLTLAELWISCDRCACATYQILKDYDPEIDLTEFQSLLLPLESQLERLDAIESYVGSRRKNASRGKPSVYRQFGKPSSFAVQYFDQCTSLQATLNDIEACAAAARKRKCEELKDLQNRYRQYMDTYNSNSCEYRTITTNSYHGWTQQVHDWNCRRCRAKKNADSLTIDIYEWPLSSSKPVAKATVFELQVPEAFSSWRDASIYFIATVLGCSEQNPQRARCFFRLENHHGISHMISSGYRQRRIVPLSEVKSHTSTHRKMTKAIQLLTESDVCLENALQYRYYDNIGEHFNTARPVCTEEIPRKCMYQMPQRSKILERFMYYKPSLPDGLPANEVIASLSDCPAHLSIDEYKALCALPLGNHVMYSNMLVQLAVPALDFTKVETQCLIFQAVQRAGPQPAELEKCIERATHDILTEPSFGRVMLENLETALARIEENWESWRAAATFSLLARRVLDLSTASEIHSRALNYLIRLRAVCLRWVLRLKKRASASTDDDQRTELYSRATEIALVCTSTYDVDEADFDSILEHELAISTLIQSSIIIEENTGIVDSESITLFTSTFQSWRRMMYRILPELRHRVLIDSRGVSDALSVNWAAFTPASDNPWISLSDCQEHWLQTTSGPMPVHLNLLTGELLVNGLPLSQLPSEYMSHNMYKPLFQKSKLEVVPTDEPGMRFSAKASYYGYKLHFGMKNRDMLVVAYNDSTKLDLIPSRMLQEQFPDSFSINYIHWFDHQRGEVIFRCRNSPWKSENGEWRLIRSSGKTWRLVNLSSVLISLESPSATLFSRLFQSLEDKRHVHAKLESATKTISIDLPRLQLGFYIEKGGRLVHSYQYRDMVIDQDQSIGTLVGLASKLVLKHRHAAERLVLIPVPQTFDTSSVVYGDRAFPYLHTIISINKGNVNKAYAYTIDSDLGRLLDTSDLQSRLFLSYLHAITSGCLPDPLTARTGTESSLEILKSAAVHSFDVLSPMNVALLCCIGELSAKREWYPKHLRVMQSIEWDDRLPSLLQHGSFRTLVLDLLDQTAKMQLFHPGNNIFVSINTTRERLRLLSNPALDQRDMIRSCNFRVAGFGAEKFTTSQDTQYQARDVVQDERGGRAFIIGSLALRDQAALHSPIPNLRQDILRKHFKEATVEGVHTSFDPESLGYDAKWLKHFTDHLVDNWCTLHNSLPKARNRYSLATWLCTMAFATEADMDAIQALMAFWRISETSAVQPPDAALFNLNMGDTFRAEQVRHVLRQNARSFDESDEAMLPRKDHESDRKHEQRIEALFHDRKEKAIERVVDVLRRQRLRQSPNVELKKEYTTYINLTKAMVNIRDCFQNWYNNHSFLDYLEQLGGIMACQKVFGVPSLHYYLTTPQNKARPSTNDRYFSTSSIFVATAPSLGRNSSSQGCPAPPCEPRVTVAKTDEHELNFQKMERLEDLCQRLMSYAKSKCEREYVEYLQISCGALKQHLNTNHTHKDLVANASDILQQYLHDCKHHLARITSSFESLFKNEISFRVKHAPRISPTFWLSQLHRDRFELLTEDWKESILGYALAITNLQRAQRLVHLSGKEVELIEELQHIGHSNWDVRQFPETLLLEAESGILVRKEQEYIASQMRSPEKGQNIVLQLLMGGGKSTTIVPILSAYHGNKKKLVRVIVAKPQSKQMLQMLVAKLGGMLGRRIYQMPFSRNLRLSTGDAKIIRQIYDECIANRGVLLIQPEHILSFKLMAVESVLADHKDVARSLLSTQEFFDRVSVDCVDESDENFSVKFELIYTMGAQQPMEFSPMRWLIIQRVLAPLAVVAAQVKKEFPDAVDIQDSSHGKYPRIRFLTSESADRVLHMLAKHVVHQGIGIPSRSQSPALQNAIVRYITEADLEVGDIQSIEHSKFWTETTRSPLLLLRGLFGNGVLRFVFSNKRYRVNFGLDHSRTALAVPYRSKDSPSPRSEFSHPDVVIILTLLSYYYQGLTDNELFDTFAHVLKSDQSVIHYDEFVRTASPSLPKAFHQLSGISIRDRHQCIMEVFPSLRYSKNAIDYYLSNLVFPKQLKQFPQKLSASGWDLAITKPHPTTGFSGTNDTLHLLPLNIKHLDLPSQHHTNAQVLSYLLMDETSVETLPERKPNSNKSDGEHLLTFIKNLNSDIRVVLDCGASILEQNNRQVAETWLKMCDSDIQAVVYFENEELSVLDRSCRIDSFQTSPYAKMLDSCVVYLDEAHTRGTDLKLPRHYRAALTLGSHLSKDRLTQAAMRMRKLGHGQAVTFIVPGEIKTKIFERTGKPSDAPIDAYDVLSWAIGETWSELKKSLPLWAVQGERFERHKHLLKGVDTTKDEATAFLENESADLEARYKPRSRGTNDFSQLSDWDMSNPNIDKIVSRCRDFEAMGFGSAALSEEQERELAPEIEQERQIERPPRLDARSHRVHADLERLVTTGEFVTDSEAWKPAFQALHTISASRLINLDEFPTDLLATVDFMRTVRIPSGSTHTSFISDSYQRPVQFVLSVPDPDRPETISRLVIISPHEANLLLSSIRDFKEVTLHLFSARPNISFASLDALTLYNIGRAFSPGSVSRSLTMQLNLFAGSLYLRSMAEYHELCNFLGLLHGRAEEGQEVYADGFIDPPTGKWGLTKSPVPFLRTLLMKIRREGEGVEKTHMGKILDGVALEEGDFKGLGA